MINGVQHTFFMPAPDGQVKWCFIVDERRWEGMTFTWKSPLAQKVLGRSSRQAFFEFDEVAVRALALGQPAPYHRGVRPGGILRLERDRIEEVGGQGEMRAPEQGRHL